MNKSQTPKDKRTGDNLYWWGAGMSDPNGIQSDGLVWGYPDSSMATQTVYEEVFPITAKDEVLSYFHDGLSGPGNASWINFKAPNGYHIESGHEWYAIINGQKKEFDADVNTYTPDDFIGNDYDPNEPKDYYVTMYANWLDTTGWIHLPDEQSSYGSEGSKYWWYINSDGSVHDKGWVADGSKWRYISPSTWDRFYKDMYEAGETSDMVQPDIWSSHTVYYGGNFAYRNEWAQIDDHWYYFDDDGYMLTNWQQIDNRWYYLGSDGIMRTGLQTINGGIYYFNDDGVMQTGWHKVDGKYYYFVTDGYARTGWYQEGSYWYYLTSASDHDEWGSNYPTGSMLADTWMDQNGKRYYFDTSGHCTNPEGSAISSGAKKNVLLSPRKITTFDSGINAKSKKDSK